MRRRGVVRTVLAVATVCLTGTVRALGEADLYSYNDAYLQPDVVETAPSVPEPSFADAPPVIKSSALGPAAGCRMVLVSTLDGRISALDTAAGGALLWSLQASEAGMLRSTLTQNLQLSQLGQWVRLIPSLDGRLFTYDGDQVEALPVTAETLLQSSFRFADDTVIMGGSEVVTLGIDLRTGRIRYRCGTDGCVRNSGVSGGEWDEADEDDGDVLVLRQHTQTVRAVEPRSGQERWNFSVSRHELAMSAGERTSSQPDPPPVDSLLTAALSEGRLSGVERGRRWQHQFHGPLVHVWRLDGGQLHEVDLLSPAASGDDPGTVRPLLYLGVHQHQLYIQQSRAAADGVTAHSRLVVSPDARAPPLVKWRPYMVSANSRTPVIYGTTKRHQNPLLLGDGAAGTALALRPEEYPYEGGYYLYSSDCVLPEQETHGPFPNPQLPAGEHLNFDDDGSVVYVVITSLSYWWPQIMLMSVSIAVILNLLVTEHYRLYYRAKALRAVRTVLRLRPPRLVVREVAVPVREEVIREVVKEVVRDAPPSTPPAPQSRFLEDFEPIQCLGKGGFGVVFEARNKLDGQSYAVKRIRLPNRERARRKVLREVSCLAKLDHRNIVRYSHCWTEKLSPACLEQQDSVLDTSEWVSSRTPLNSLDSGGVVSAPPSPEDEVSGSVLRMTQFASALPGEAGEEDWRLRTLGGGFLPALGETQDPSQSRSGAAEDSIVFSRATSVDSSGTFSLLDGHELATQQSRTGLGRRQRSSGESASGSAGTPSPRQRPPSDSRVPTSDGDDDDSVVFAAESGGPVVDYTLPDSEGSTGTGSGTSAGPVVAFQTKQGGLTDGSSLWEDDGAAESDGEAVYLFIQMQLCRKESLKDWLSANCGPRSAPRVLAIFRQILNGVEYVHGQRLMHRDLKPSNIFFSLDGIVKIGDFGLATTMGSEPTHHTPACAHNCADSRHTNHVGTQLYMSPEQVLGHPYDAKVDIYSLGIILFELLVPFSTQMERQRVLTLVRRLVFPEPFQRQQPDEHSLLTQMLCHQPARRPPIAEIRRSVSRCRAQSRGGALLEDELDGRPAAKATLGNGGQETPAGKDGSLGFNIASGADAAGLGLDLSVKDESGEDSDGWEAGGLNSTVLNSSGMIFVGPDRSEPDSTGLVFTGLISPESGPGGSPAPAASEASLSDSSPAREAAADGGEPLVDSVVPTRPPGSRLYLAGLEASGRDSEESSGDD